MLFGLGLSPKEEHVTALKVPVQGVFGVCAQIPWLTLTA
jgi:hypothetical protein